MSQKLRQLAQNQPKINVVAQQADHANLNNGWFITLAAFFAGVFYFLGYYFWGNTVAHLLTGN